jgi:hypothetical protein
MRGDLLVIKEGNGSEMNEIDAPRTRSNWTLVQEHSHLLLRSC